MKQDLDDLVKEVAGLRKDFSQVKLIEDRVGRMRTELDRVQDDIRDLPVLRAKVERCD